MEPELNPNNVYSWPDWDKKLEAVKIKKEDMNKLVMNFFLIEGFLDNAHMFHLETGTEHMDPATVIERIAVKEAVLCGNVDDAIQKANSLNPNILDSNPELHFLLLQLKTIDLILEGKMEEAVEFAHKNLAPIGETSTRYLEDIERTMTLLIYEDLSTCPFNDLVNISIRRKNIAREVNLAILTSQGYCQESNLRTLLKMLGWNQDNLKRVYNFPRVNEVTPTRLNYTSL